MLKGLFIAGFVILALSTSFAAAEIYNKPKTQKAAEPSAQPEQKDVLELLDKAPPIEKPQANPQSVNDFANQYYKNCMSKEHPFLKGEDQKLLCGCTSAKIPENMTIQQMRDMQKGGKEGELQRGRMMLFVYTPCIRYPTRALVLNQCLNNPQIKESMKHYQRVCTCLADSMADYMDEKAPPVMENALRRNMTDIDPLRTLMESKGFEERSQYYMKKCITRHELGIK